MTEKVKELIDNSHKVLIIQADNPDGDSLGTALALDTILGVIGKETYLYCGVDMPGYLRYMRGWDRVSSEVPTDFDLSIIVDASTMTLLEKLTDSGKQGVVSSRPVIVFDHHGTVDNQVDFATVLINDTSVSSTGELVYVLAKELGWSVDVESGKFIMSAILGDTQGLSNLMTSAQTYRVMAELVEIGVDRPGLEEQRRELSKMPPEVFAYKARLIERTEFHVDGKLALVDVPHDEIMEFSPLYNPAPLIQTDMLQTTGVGVAVVIKHYKDGKILGAIRCNPGYNVAAELAQHFGGGGHPYASGFKIQDGRPFNEIKSECIKVASELLAKLEQEKPHEDTQYAYSTD
jgi:phosphoesterase RecJ-like protein